jgi:hypothetical protein
MKTVAGLLTLIIVSGIIYEWVNDSGMTQNTKGVTNSVMVALLAPFAATVG